MTETIVTKLDKAPVFVRLEPREFEKPKAGQSMAFEVNLSAEAMDGMKKVARVKPNLPTWGSFEIVCDEGMTLGGEDAAPPPLGYLSAGIAFCLLTHLKMVARSRKLAVGKITIEQRTNFETSFSREGETEGQAVGACKGVETHLIIESDEHPQVLEALAVEAERACLAMQSIVNATPVKMTLHIEQHASA